MLCFLQREALQILCSQVSLPSSIPPFWKNSRRKTDRYFNQEMVLISISNSCFPFNLILHSEVCLWKLPLIMFFISQCSEMANGPAHLISPSCMIMFQQVYSWCVRLTSAAQCGCEWGCALSWCVSDSVTAAFLCCCQHVARWRCDNSQCQKWRLISPRAC